MKVLQNISKINLARRASTVLFQFLVSSEIENWILPANICYVVPLVFIKAGKRIQLIDINSVTLLIDKDLVFERLKNHSKSTGLLINYTYGIEFSQKDWICELKEMFPNLSIIEDKCLCMPKLDETLDLNVDMVLYSTGYAKYCDLGYGGYGFTNSEIKPQYFDFDIESEKDVLDFFKNEINQNYFYKNNSNIELNWLDNRKIERDLYFSEIINTLPQIILFKNRINNIYSSNLPTDIQLSSEFQNWRFNIITNKKKKILNEIFSNKLFASNHYSDMSFYFHRIRAENAYKIYNEVINLFNYKYINEIQAYKITEIINKNLE